MAIKKVENTLEWYLAVTAHTLIYSLPFLLIASYEAVFVIFITHWFIDKYRLANYLIQLKNWCFTKNWFPEWVPPFLTVWIMIIVDNTLHLTINYLAIYYLR